MISYGLEHPLVTWSRLPWLLLLPTSPCSPKFLTSVAGLKAEKALSLYEPYPAIAKPFLLPSLCLAQTQNTPTVKNINSISAKTRTRISESAAEAFHSLKYLLLKGFLDKQRGELAAFKEIEANQHFQSSQESKLFITSHQNLGSVGNLCKKAFQIGEQYLLGTNLGETDIVL